MMDMGVYPLQAARYVTGQEPVTVTAQGYRIRPQYKDAEEAATFQLTFPGGGIASLSTGFHASFNHLLVSARHGWFELNPFSGYRGIKGKTRDGVLQFPPMNQQATQMDDVALCILEGKPMKVPGEEGLRDMIVVDAIYQSMETGKKININR